MENQELQKLSTSNANLTISLQPNLQLRELDRELAKKEIANALLRLAALYQIVGFATVNAFVLSDWILDNLKFKKLGLILDALKNPPILYENGEVLRNWRLNPDTVYAWVDKKSIEAENLRQIERTREDRDKIIPAGDLSYTGQEMIKSYLNELSKGMFKNRTLKEPSPEVKRIDLLLKLLSDYKKDVIDPITGKKFEDAPSEEVWLFEKGYYFENGELKKL